MIYGPAGPAGPRVWGSGCEVHAGVPGFAWGESLLMTSLPVCLLSGAVEREGYPLNIRDRRIFSSKVSSLVCTELTCGSADHILCCPNQATIEIKGRRIQF